MRRDHRFMSLAFWLAASLALAGSAVAQPAAPQTNTPNALQGFSKNRDQPVEIAATSLEVRDKDKVATFSGNVHVIQGEMHLRSQTLKVFYEGETAAGKTGAKPAAKSSSLLAAQPGPDGQSKIKRLEASGGVTVTQNDQVASGKTGVFDMPTNTVTLSGDVVVSQGKNVSRGDTLVVDLTTGTSKMTGGKGVRMILDPSSKPDGKPKDGAAPAPGAKPPTSLQAPR
jgi:lipopolysaccharide export system protein LptA